MAALNSILLDNLVKMDIDRTLPSIIVGPCLSVYVVEDPFVSLIAAYPSNWSLKGQDLKQLFRLMITLVNSFQSLYKFLNFKISTCDNQKICCCSNVQRNTAGQFGNNLH